MMRLLMLATMMTTTNGAAFAQELEPRDFSPTDDLGIRVVSMEPGSIGITRILVEVINRSQAVMSASVSCSLYSSAKQPIGDADGNVLAIPPKSPATKTIMAYKDEVGGAFCRITYSYAG